MGAMRLVDSSALDESQLSSVQSIYLDAFPESLRVPFEDLLVDRLLVLLHDGRPVGFALVRALGPTSWMFLRYYAVGPKGGGLGTTMWRELTDRLAAEGTTRLVWDVEDPDEPGIDTHEAEVHRRRIGFYERLGARLLPVRGYAPPHDGEIGAPPLLLMDQRLDASNAFADAEPDLQAIVTGVYLWRYGVPASDALVVDTLRASGILVP
ncbi:GNAT family N-acetyltransferase [Nocardioides sp. R-C-SC26]|uniref:GNAT family N-acetyltransferase n=1 Tax=Nocardioides sp. R-C-SC26 TaxID=2870414 RepID=UPI001E54DC5F|nr:GNAT family N-acetyltransferase [Nocardioides sp. R-C-SC26]